MKIGFCCSPEDVVAVGEKCLPVLAKGYGYDYFELPLSSVAAMNDAGFTRLLSAVQTIGLPCEATNVLFPGSLRLTGTEVSLPKVAEYLELAFDRAHRLGAQVCVFGSAGARNVPQGFPKERAWVQLVEMLRMAAPIAEKNGLAMAIEPLNHNESNIINSGAEGFALARLVERPNIGLLLDFYHMAVDGEDPGIAVTARQVLRHAHFADPDGRIYPKTLKDSFRPFFAALKTAGYQGRVSIEAGFESFIEDAPPTLAILRTLSESSE
jgi:D-psicose/D-tagatose/L-ribulose 3-epimerase